MARTKQTLRGTDAGVLCGIGPMESRPDPALHPFGCGLASRVPVVLGDVAPPVLGRGDLAAWATIEDLKVAREQLKVVRSGEGYAVTSVGVNPSGLVRDRHLQLLRAQQTEQLQSGDVLILNSREILNSGGRDSSKTDDQLTASSCASLLFVSGADPAVTERLRYAQLVAELAAFGRTLAQRAQLGLPGPGPVCRRSQANAASADARKQLADGFAELQKVFGTVRAAGEQATKHEQRLLAHAVEAAKTPEQRQNEHRERAQDEAGELLDAAAEQYRSPDRPEDDEYECHCECFCDNDRYGYGRGYGRYGYGAYDSEEGCSGDCRYGDDCECWMDTNRDFGRIKRAVEQVIDTGLGEMAELWSVAVARLTVLTMTLETWKVDGLLTGRPAHLELMRKLLARLGGEVWPAVLAAGKADGPEREDILTSLHRWESLDDSFVVARGMALVPWTNPSLREILETGASLCGATDQPLAEHPKVIAARLVDLQQREPASVSRVNLAAYLVRTAYHHQISDATAAITLAKVVCTIAAGFSGAILAVKLAGRALCCACSPPNRIAACQILMEISGTQPASEAVFKSLSDSEGAASMEVLLDQSLEPTQLIETCAHMLACVCSSEKDHVMISKLDLLGYATGQLSKGLPQVGYLVATAVISKLTDWPTSMKGLHLQAFELLLQAGYLIGPELGASAARVVISKAQPPARDLNPADTLKIALCAISHNDAQAGISLLQAALATGWQAVSKVGEATIQEVSSFLAQHDPELLTKLNLLRLKEQMSSSASLASPGLKAALKAALATCGPEAMEDIVNDICKLHEKPVDLLDGIERHSSYQAHQMPTIRALQQMASELVVAKMSDIAKRMQQLFDVATMLRGNCAAALAKQLCRRADQIAHVSLQAAIPRILDSTQGSLPCNTAHRAWINYCRRCLDHQNRMIKVCSVLQCFELTLARASWTCQSPMVRKAISELVARPNRSKIKQPTIALLQQLLSQLTASPGLAALPQFAGLSQPPLDVLKCFKPSECHRVPALVANLPSTGVFSWAAPLLKRAGQFGEQILQRIQDEDVDSSLLIELSSTWSDFCEALVPEMSFEWRSESNGSASNLHHWILLRRFWLEVCGASRSETGGRMLGRSTELNEDEVIKAWVTRVGGAESLAMSACQTGDVGLHVLCSLGSEADVFARGGAVGFESALRSLYNATQHSNKQAVELSSMKRLDEEVVSCVVLGATGAGKSTMLNALLGEAQILPTNCMRACTATVIEMVFNWCATPGAPYRAEVEMVTVESWRDEVTRMLATISEHAKQESEDAPENAAALEASLVLAKRAEEAIAKLKSVYGASFDSCANNSVDGLLDRVESVLGTTMPFSAASGTHLQAALAQYVDSSNKLAQGALWPLVQRVTIAGPWELLSGGLKLVDAPGVNDDNAARDRVVKDRLCNADIVLLVSNIRRAVNDKAIKDWLPLDLRQWFAKKGRMGQLAFAVSQSDVLTRSEIVKNLNLPTTTTTTQAALARNEFTTRRITESFWFGIDRADLPVNNPAPSGLVREAQFDIPVFTCSAREFQQKTGVCEQDGCTVNVFPDSCSTQIPALQAFLRVATESTRQADVKAGALLIQHQSCPAVGLATSAATPNAAQPKHNTSTKRKADCLVIDLVSSDDDS